MPRRLRRYSYADPTDGAPDVQPTAVNLRAAEDGAEGYCGRCAYYVAPAALGDEGACVIVEGGILPEQVCELFTARPDPTALELPPPPPLPEGETPPAAPEAEPPEPAEVPVVIVSSGALVASGGYLLEVPLPELEGEDLADAPLPMSRVAVIMREGEPSADGRLIERGALTWREPPLTLTINHDPDQRAGMVTAFGRVSDLAALEQLAAGGEVTPEAFAAAVGEVGDYLVARFQFDDVWYQDVAREVEVGIMRGVSVEIGNEDADYVETVDGDALYIVHSGRIGAVSLTPFQAIESARVLVPDAAAAPAVDDVPVVAEVPDATARVVARAEIERLAAQLAAMPYEVIGDLELPIADRDLEWDGDGAGQRVADLCPGEADAIDPACYGRAFLWRDPDGDPTTRGAYSLGFADVVEGRLQMVPRGVFAVAGVLSGARDVNIPEADQDRLRSRVSGLYERMAEAFDDPTLVAPWDQEAAQAVAASGGPMQPPASWFADPGLTEPTPLTITADGHVYGHLALWGTCHIGRPGVCTTPPHSATGYAYFAKPGAVLCDDGTTVAAGKITLGTGHAPVARGVTAQAAAQHYDHTGSVVADVAAGEDEFGIWLAGRLRPDVSDLQVQQLRAADPSGDWRPVPEGLELVAALAVNVPGFPVRPTSQAVVASGQQLALFASSGLRASAEDCGCHGGDAAADRLARLEAIVEALGLDRQALEAIAASLVG